MSVGRAELMPLFCSYLICKIEVWVHQETLCEIPRENVMFEWCLCCAFKMNQHKSHILTVWEVHQAILLS